MAFGESEQHPGSVDFPGLGHIFGAVVTCRRGGFGALDGLQELPAPPVFILKGQIQCKA